MLLRPKDGADDAVGRAYILLGIPYDFNYETDDEKLYCFELINKCYPQANMRVYLVEKLFGLIRRRCFLAKSVYANIFFSKKFEKNYKKQQ